MKIINVISMSGGKDSTATALLALNRGGDNRFLFADTGHEHQMTYDYIDYLEDALGIAIERVKADFSEQIAKRRAHIEKKWVDEGVVTDSELRDVLSVMQPTGNPFLDLCIWKGMFPTSTARFCTQYLKHEPIDMRMLQIAKAGIIKSWQGIRADESLSRSKMPAVERGEFYVIYRPILTWTADDVFAFHKKHEIEPNPLYKQAMTRVGCMPCIFAKKADLAEIARRFPEEIDRVQQWEKIVSSVARRRMSTFFDAGKDPVVATSQDSQVNHQDHGIWAVMNWATTSRGGRQFDLIASTEEVPMCSSVYGLCE